MILQLLGAHDEVLAEGPVEKGLNDQVYLDCIETGVASRYRIVLERKDAYSEMRQKLAHAMARKLNREIMGEIDTARGTVDEINKQIDEFGAEKETTK